MTLPRICAALLVLSAVALNGLPCAAEAPAAASSVRRELSRVSTALRRAPYLMPIWDGEEFARLEYQIGPDGRLTIGARRRIWTVPGESERRRFELLSRAPQYWIVVLDQSGHAVYWAPIQTGGVLRSEIPAEDGSHRIVARARAWTRDRGTVSVPYVPGGTLHLVGPHDAISALGAFGSRNP